MKKIVAVLSLLLLVGCVNPVNPNPNPSVVPSASQQVIFRDSQTSHIIMFGNDSHPVKMSVVNEYNIGDTFSRVYGALGKPVLARIQPDNGVVLVYNVEGLNERVYFVFRGGNGQLARISNSPNTKIAE